MLNKKKLIIVMFFLVLILLINYYINSLNKQYIINIKDMTIFKELSNEFIYFGRPTYPNCEQFKLLLEEVVKEENKQVYYFDIDYFRNNSIINDNELNEIFEKYSINEIPAIIKLKDDLLDGLFSGNILNEEKTDKIKEEVREFITYELFPQKYITHYTIIIILFIFSILLFLFKNRLSKTNNVFVILLMVIFSNYIILYLTFQAAVKYIDYNGLSGNPKIMYIIILTIIINFISLVKLIIDRKKFQSN